MWNAYRYRFDLRAGSASLLLPASRSPASQRKHTFIRRIFSPLQGHIQWDSVEWRKSYISYIHKLIPRCVCSSGLPSLQRRNNRDSPLDWLHFWIIPLSTVKDCLVGLALLQRNWPFKEGLHHVKPCNWEWHSLCTICLFVRLFSGSSSQLLLSTCVSLNVMFLQTTPYEPSKSGDLCWAVAVSHCVCGDAIRH